jgi:uncharacterized coiled-coil DUF342 family protein
MTIKIYEKEISDGIGELVKSTASVAYCSEAKIHQGSIESAKQVISKNCSEEVLNKVVAENKDQIDLYYLESVLVSTGWNKNDDVFLSEATWAARNTPEDKQFNFMHDENDIIGHITGSYVLTKDGKAVGDEDIERPDEFDIITQAVLYNSWTNQENKDRMEKIISEIKEGKWFVSMECLFAGFDYALINEKGVAKILKRDEASAFLTKHLRAYGGTGEYEGYKLGRALSNISFSGKGLVSKPANPRSVILQGASAQFNLDDNSELSIGELKMSDVLTNQVAELKAQLDAAKAENEAIKAKIEEAKDKEFASKVQAFENSAEESKATIDQLNEVIKSTQARVAELEDALASSQTQLAEAMKSMDEMKKKEKMQKRMAALIEAGFDQEDVEATLAAFDALEDEAFDAVVAMYGKKKASKHENMESPEKEKKEEKMAKSEEAEAEISEEAFEGVESSEATLVVTEDNELEATRASVADWFSNHVLNK